MTATASPHLTKDRVFDLIQGYRNTSLLRTGIRLGVFDCLAEGPLTAGDVSAQLDLDPRGGLILLNALAAIGLLEVADGVFSLAPGAREWLVSGSAGSVANLVHVLASDWEWDALKVLDEAVRTGGTVVREQAETPDFRYWQDFATHATAATGPTADLVARELAGWMAARPSVDVLDVACGHGLYGYALAARDPSVRVWDLDWPHVLEIAAGHAERLGVRDRVHHIPGDMFEEPLGGPYDVALVTNVLHHFSEERATELLRRVAGALKPDGRLVVVGFTLTDEPPDRDPAPYLFSVLMLAWTTAGEVHTERAYDRMLTAAGFTAPAVHRLPNVPMRVLIADRAHP
ncbi:methyltransferase [Saccharothrix coeruleofusca]|uniref:O-methyltransferase n=1 Tax=Saccharothrix coeruleofusca TaxID=33919 RepID=A0A918APE2_9PSEU|nr:methyltransferase [Saccharothrix coeruleofusca]MBP2337205.1 C-methyltransferase [Saccharothrix coeruleofusca]GGP66429.1 O-methyltransferase [Saccharothrix coeruleofusca]